MHGQPGFADRPDHQSVRNCFDRPPGVHSAREGNKRPGWRIERYESAEMPLPVEPGVREVRASEERGHAKTRDTAGGNRETDEPRFVAPDEPAHIQGLDFFR
jgi:hypothetical protein